MKNCYLILVENCKDIPKETIFKKDNSGWTPLLVAAHNGKLLNK